MYKCIKEYVDSDTEKIYMSTTCLTIGKYYYTYDVPRQMLDKYKEIIDKFLYIKDDNDSLLFIDKEYFISVVDDREEKLNNLFNV